MKLGRVELEAWLYMRSDNFLAVRALCGLVLATFYMKMFLVVLPFTVEWHGFVKLKTN